MAASMHCVPNYEENRHRVTVTIQPCMVSMVRTVSRMVPWFDIKIGEGRI